LLKNPKPLLSYDMLFLYQKITNPKNASRENICTYLFSVFGCHILTKYLLIFNSTTARGKSPLFIGKTSFKNGFYIYLTNLYYDLHWQKNNNILHFYFLVGSISCAIVAGNLAPICKYSKSLQFFQLVCTLASPTWHLPHAIPRSASG
jgi:hypothetical protein